MAQSDQVKLQPWAIRSRLVWLLLACVSSLLAGFVIVGYWHFFTPFDVRQTNAYIPFILFLTLAEGAADGTVASHYYYPLWCLIIPFACLLRYAYEASKPIADGRYGQAKYASRREAEKFDLDIFAKKGISLGRLDPPTFHWPPSRRYRRDHNTGIRNEIKRRRLQSGRSHYLAFDQPLAAMCFAPPGTGKTAGMVIPTMARANDSSIVVHDPKGEIYSKTAAHRASLHGQEKLYILNFMDPRRSSRWNPFAEFPRDISPTSLDRIEYFVGVVANVLIPEMKANVNSVFVDNGREMLTSLIFYLYLRRLEEGTIMAPADLMSFFSYSALEFQDEKEPNRQLWSAHQEYARVAGYPERVLNGFIAASTATEHTLANFQSNVKSGLKPFFTRQAQIITSTSDFTLADIDNSLCSVFLVNPATDTNYKPIIGLFLDMLIRFRNAKDPNELEIPLSLVLDEAAFLPPVDMLINGPAIMRSHKVRWLYVAQSPSQFTAEWGRDKYAILRNTIAFVVVYTQNSFEDARSVSDDLGTTTLEASKRPRGDPGSTKVHQQRNLQSASLITPNAVKSIPRFKQILVVQGHGDRPLFCSIPVYFEDPLCLKLFTNDGYPMPAERNYQPVAPVTVWADPVSFLTPVISEENEDAQTVSVTTITFEPQYIIPPKKRAPLQRKSKSRTVGQRDLDLAVDLSAPTHSTE